MFLKGQKVRGIGLKTNFTNLPELLTEEQTKELVIANQNGDLKARDTLIVAHMRLAISISTKYAVGRVNKAEDIISVAMEALVDAVSNFATRGRDSKIGAYISSTIQGRIADFIKHDRLIHIPKSLDEKEIPPVTESLEFVEQEPTYLDDETKLEITEMIESLTLSAIEYKVLKLKLANWKNTDIAKNVGRSREFVGFTLAKVQDKIRTKFHETLDETGDSFFGFNWRE